MNRKRFAQFTQAANDDFDRLQEAIEDLGDSLTDIQQLSTQLATQAPKAAVPAPTEVPVNETSSEASMEEAYPLPKVAVKKVLKGGLFKFSSASTAHGLHKPTRVIAAKK